MLREDSHYLESKKVQPNKELQGSYGVDNWYSDFSQVPKISAFLVLSSLEDETPYVAKLINNKLYFWAYDGSALESNIPLKDFLAWAPIKGLKSF